MHLRGVDVQMPKNRGSRLDNDGWHYKLYIHLVVGCPMNNDDILRRWKRT